MNENGNIDSYDIMVKYNTNIDTSKVFQGTYDEFIQEKADIGTDIFGEPIPGDRIVTRNKQGQKVLGYYDTNMAIRNCYINYTGYLKLKTDNVNIKGQILVDNKPLEWVEEEPNTNKGYYEFDGYVNNSIIFNGKDTGGISFVFDEFITNPYDLSLSEDTFKTYVIYDEDNYINSEWGELIINETYQPTLKFNWYNPSNDVATEYLEANYPSYKTNYPEGPKIIFQSGVNEDDMLINNWPKSVVYWDPLILNNGEEFYSDNSPSGWKDLGYNGAGLTTFPILIHKNDIGKQNTIGPLIRQDGSEIYINLTII